MISYWHYILTPIVYWVIQSVVYSMCYVAGLSGVQMFGLGHPQVVHLYVLYCRAVGCSDVWLGSFPGGSPVCVMLQGCRMFRCLAWVIPRWFTCMCYVAGLSGVQMFGLGHPQVVHLYVLCCRAVRCSDVWPGPSPGGSPVCVMLQGCPVFRCLAWATPRWFTCMCYIAGLSGVQMFGLGHPQVVHLYVLYCRAVGCSDVWPGPSPGGSPVCVILQGCRVSRCLAWAIPRWFTWWSSCTEPPTAADTPSSTTNMSSRRGKLWVTHTQLTVLNLSTFHFSSLTDILLT